MKNHATNPRIRKQIRNRAAVLERAERQAARRTRKDDPMDEREEPMTGRQLIADLEALGTDPNTLRVVRYGLGAIADRIRREAELPHHLNAVGAAAIVDPGIAA